MDVKVCKNCRRLFKYIYGPELCPECLRLAEEEKKEQYNQSSQDNKSNQSSQGNQKTQETLATQNAPAKKTLTSTVKSMLKEEEAKFEQVRDYIMLNPRATVSQISEVNDIAPTKLFEWIRDDRLEFSENSEYAWFNCEKCGVKIKSGRVCNRCKIR